MGRESNILVDATRPPAKSGVPQDEGQSGGDERRQRRARNKWTAPGWRTRRQGGVEDDHGREIVVAVGQGHDREKRGPRLIAFDSNLSVAAGSKAGTFYNSIIK